MIGLSHHLSSAESGADDFDVRPAAAQVAGGRVANGFGVGLWILFQEERYADDLPRGAIATLGRIFSDERLLNRMEVTILRESFDGGDRAALAIHGQHQAGVDGHAIERDGTRAAVPHPADDFGSG